MVGNPLLLSKCTLDKMNHVTPSFAIRKLILIATTAMKIHAIVITARWSPVQRKLRLLESEGARDVNMLVL